MGTCKKCKNIFGAFELDENKLCEKCAQVGKPKESFEVTKDESYKEDKATTNLINCKTCNKKISKNAVSCPHCGEPLILIDENVYEEKKESSGVSFGSLLITGIIIYALFKLFVGGLDSPSTTKTSYKSSTYSNSSDECYELIKKWNNCINRSAAGLVCLPGTDIVLPDRCNKAKYLNSLK